jgi:hypothetical protein
MPVKFKQGQFPAHVLLLPAAWSLIQQAGDMLLPPQALEDNHELFI